MDGAGNAGAAPRYPRDRNRTIRICSQRARARNAARPRGTPAGRGLYRDERRRKNGGRDARPGEGSGEEEFRGRGGGKTVAGPAGGGETEGDVGAWKIAEPRRVLRATAESEAYARHPAGRFERRGAEDGASRHGDQSHLSASLPSARIDGQLLRGCRCARREGHHLVAYAGRLVPA